MPGEHRIRVRVLGGNRSRWGLVKAALGSDLDVDEIAGGREFVISARTETRLVEVREGLLIAKLEEIAGPTDVSRPTAPAGRGGREEQSAQRAERPDGGQARAQTAQGGVDLRRKPYGFVPLPDTFTTAVPVWHDGTGSEGRLSGELRFEMENLTPLLVGWERRKVVPEVESNDASGVPFEWVDRENGVVDVILDGGRGRTIASKSLLCPLRAPGKPRPVIIPGDSIKGLLRHELGALLGAPMERVAERSYSYRPNSLFPNEPNPRLVARLARVPVDGVAVQKLDPAVADSRSVRVPTALDLMPEALQYDRGHTRNPPRYRFDSQSGGAPYRGGIGAGVRLNSKKYLHKSVDAIPTTATRVLVPTTVQAGYLHTLRHLTDLSHGHFSERHPDVPNTVTGDDARSRILDAAATVVFAPGDLVWVEWDTRDKCIVSVGWHYYYRWAYQDTVRQEGWTGERDGLFPLPVEKGAVPSALSAVRRLFGYTGDNSGSRGIGQGDHEQLMGRISVNAAVEVVSTGATVRDRFLPPTFLRELGMPRPSAVEFYLQQPHHPNQRPSDRASLVTYGDAAGYDKPGKLGGRKFYLDRKDAYEGGNPWEDKSEPNRLNDRSTLALEASKPGRRYRFTLRFRDLDPAELAAILLALCPNQFAEAVGGAHADGYCSKLGYARPLGWGTVRVVAKAMYLLDESGDSPTLQSIPDLSSWFGAQPRSLPRLQEWLSVHRHKHPDAADYPNKNGQIYTFHTTLRADHSRLRRYSKERR